MTGLAAVLFDMDGTLVDSEKLWTIALVEVAAELGGTLSDAARNDMVGKDMVRSIDLLHADLGYQGDPAVTQRLLVGATAAVFRRGLPWQPGAQQLLVAVRAAGLATALVTATHRNLVAIALETLGRDNFDAVVCGDDVAQGKPDPEPYLAAMSLLGLAAGTCLAIEDSPTGATSAATAGVPVLVVPSEVAVPPGPGLVFAESLVGVDVAALQRIRSAAG